MTSPNLKALKVKDFDAGVDKATRRFLVRFHVGQGATDFFSLSPDLAAELVASISKRLPKLVVRHQSCQPSISLIFRTRGKPANISKPCAGRKARSVRIAAPSANTGSS